MGDNSGSSTESEYDLDEDEAFYFEEDAKKVAPDPTQCRTCGAELVTEPATTRRVNRVCCKCCSRLLRQSLSFPWSELRHDEDRRCRLCVKRISERPRSERKHHPTYHPARSALTRRWVEIRRKIGEWYDDDRNQKVKSLSAEPERLQKEFNLRSRERALSSCSHLS